ncbi:MAG TPA: GNAT family protein [Anaerolineales bacterium]|nr:GNAT family protein [Anaerolineales bacterium]
MGVSSWQGDLVWLGAIESEQDAAIVARWSRDSEYWRLRDSAPARPITAAQAKRDWEADGGRAAGAVFLAIRTLVEDRLIGTALLDGIGWPHGFGWLGIGIGEREFWGKGYGTDAVQVILRYAFTELNLWRVSLSVLATNARAIRAYEKCGFVLEGRVRGLAHIDGERIDEVFMGILREEWEQIRHAAQ